MIFVTLYNNTGNDGDGDEKSGGRDDGVELGGDFVFSHSFGQGEY